MFSGVQSADNPFQNMNDHYENRGPPQRKSLAAQRAKAVGGRTEVPGQESNTNSMSDYQNRKKYDQFKQTKQKEMEFPNPDNNESRSAQH